MGYIGYINGKYLPKEAICLPIEDRGFTRALAAFESLRTYCHKPFLLKEHMARLTISCKELFIPVNVDEIESIIDVLLKKSKGCDFLIRVYVTAGVEKQESSVIVLVSDLVRPTIDEYKFGVKVATTKKVRSLVHIKSNEYTSAMVALKIAQDKGYYEALYVDDHNNLLEFTRANFFGIIGNTLYTADEHVLHGTTRNCIINLAKELNMKVSIGEVPYEMIMKFDEAFLTSTTKEVLPIIQIDDIEIPRGTKADLLLNTIRSFACKDLL